ncbi:MAG TPA: nitrilase-related carbon-nitrogen hydrolase, partial [Fimbriimonadaceae bacterium]|nr:nitrilase-related carbon-nitrogen hydrolase [Fimbriimonadaceae bacterium]
MPFRLACVQFHPEMGKVKHNLDRMAEIVRQAVGEEGADLVAFPETSVSGYYVQGGACDVAMEPDEVRDGLAERLSGLGSHVDVLAGFYRKSSGEPFNSAGWFSFAPDAKTVAVYDKFFLATYTVFDEDRYVSRGRELGVFDTRFGKVGLLICEDTWHSILGTLLALHGAQIVFSLIASPGRGFQGKVPSNVDRYDRMLRAIAEEHGVYA